MKSWEKRLLAWMVCVTTALLVWMWLCRLEKLIPVRGVELPDRAIEILTEHVEDWYVPPKRDLRFYENYTVQKDRFCVVNGFFEAKGISYRYITVLHRTPFADWYLYDTAREVVYEDDEHSETFHTWVDMPLIRYNLEISYDDLQISRGISPSGAELILFGLIFPIILGIQWHLGKKGREEERQLAFAVLMILWFFARMIVQSTM